MSRDLTTDFKTAIIAGTVRPVLLIVAEFDSATLRFWNGVGDFSYGGDTYTGAGVLLKVADITETQNVEARGSVIELSGIRSSLIATVQAEEYQGRRVTQTFCPLDTSGVAIADPFLFFSGAADVMSIEYGAKFATVKMTVESDLIALGRINERRRTPEDQKLAYAGDTFFDQVSALQSRDIVWGKNG